MTATRYISTAQVARALGLSVTTVKRWVDEEVLPAQRTVGGHRKILLSDVLRLVRQNDLPHADLELLGDPSGGTDLATLSARLFKALEQGDEATTRSLLVSTFESGVTMAQLGDRVVAPAMTAVGCAWAEGSFDVYHEHTATRLCLAALLEIRQRLLVTSESERPRALVGAAEGDYAQLPSLLVEMALLEDGWEVLDLGAHTPAASFVRAVEDYRPRLLCLSVTHLENAERFLTDYRRLYETARRCNVKVAVGGRALRDEVRSGMPYTMFGDGLGQLLEFARTLCPPPPLPKRGRPART